MPVPKPKSEETQKEFIGRCMDDDNMNKEFSDREQRAGVCYSSWRKAQGKAGLVLLDKEANFDFVVENAALKAKAVEEGADPGDAGWIEGYAAVYNSLDHQREVLRPGVFAKSIKERVPAGKVKLMVRHFMYGGDTREVIGLVTEAKELSRIPEFGLPGLWMHAELSSVAVAQETRVKVLEGFVNQLSVGYRPLEWKTISWEDEEPAVELTEAIWRETTATVVPAQELAIIVAAKSILATAQDGSDAGEFAQMERVATELNALTETLNKVMARVRPEAPIEVVALQRAIDMRKRWLGLQGHLP